ncbi:THO complex subunit 7 homolog [Sycon ciliatum]|uniref:THO complex subunit 7 homolog n=1 Tax=Sycon ciliatum TaxID=27933 RepID=UPI0020A98806|eukprot:scpid49157/ scgid35555/ THO complex subunit 7 homolog
MAAAAAIAEDEIIKKRLLIDGEGDGDDRRLNRLLRTFLRFCSPSCPEEERASLYQKLFVLLAQCEFAMSKLDMVQSMNCKELDNYSSLVDKIETNVEEAHQKIADSREELVIATQIRQNRQEYNALAKVIQQHPDRQETVNQLDKLSTELTELNTRKEQHETKLALRRKQFHLLMHSIYELQGVLDDEEKDTMMDTS